MQLAKFFKMMGFITVLALVYIHMQMQIIDLAYQGNKKEQTIKALIEGNGSATYKILMLKSANHLGIAMFHENSDMHFSDTDDVVKIITSEEFLAESPLGRQPKLAKRTNPLLNLLSFGLEAEAKTAE